MSLPPWRSDWKVRRSGQQWTANGAKQADRRTIVWIGTAIQKRRPSRALLGTIWPIDVEEKRGKEKEKQRPKTAGHADQSASHVGLFALPLSLSFLWSTFNSTAICHCRLHFQSGSRQRTKWPWIEVASVHGGTFLLLFSSFCDHSQQSVPSDSLKSVIVAAAAV